MPKKTVAKEGVKRYQPKFPERKTRKHKWCTQRLIVTFECPRPLVPFIMRDISHALANFESIQKPKIWECTPQLEEIFLQADACTEAGTVYLGKPQTFWLGYLKAVKDICKEVFGLNLDDVTFEYKMRIAKTLRRKYPDGEIGFFHNAIHHDLAEIEALEGLKKLFG